MAILAVHALPTLGNICYIAQGIQGKYRLGLKYIFEKKTLQVIFKSISDKEKINLYNIDTKRPIL